MIGKTLAHYEIIGLLGKGGMGEVYRARDTKLEREVAIKVLPAAFVEDAERLARFEREAKLLAQLNHPNIAHIYGMEASGDIHALAMELIEGPTLAERLEQGALPLDESLSLARQIAEALEEAHEKGIIHRDLKPQNIKVSGDGKVKVLDFGLAKAMDPTGEASGPGGASQLTQSPTLTMGATQMGVVLGTAAYMSPEQAKGSTVDKRADIWSFGVVLHEMLTGKLLFEGDSVPETLAGVLKNPIDVDALPAEVPAELRHLLRRCLERNPKNRLHDVADARLVIDDLLAGRVDAPGGEAPAGSPVRAVRAWLFAVTALALGVIGTFAVMSLTGRDQMATPGGAMRTTIGLPDSLELEDSDRPIALSPDGSRLLVVARDAEDERALYLRSLDDLRLEPLAGTSGARYPFWSPDGRSIGFFADGKLRRLDLASGGVRAVCDAVQGRGATWSPRGTIVFSPGASGPLLQVSEDGGTPTEFTQVAREGEDQRNPHYLPDGRSVLFFARNRGEPGEKAVYVFDPQDGAPKKILDTPSEALYVEPGHLAFVAEGSLMLQPFDVRKFELSGSPRPIAADVRYTVVRSWIGAGFAPNGTLVYERDPGLRPFDLFWLDEAGQESPAWSGILDRSPPSASLSPDGRRAAIVWTDAGSVFRNDLIDFEGATRARLGGSAERALRPAWSPDGERLLVRRIIDGEMQLAWMAPRPDATVHPLTSEKGMDYQPGSFTPDGRSVVFSGWSDVDQLGDVFIIDLEGGSPPRPILTGPGHEAYPRLSPSGRRLAFTSNASGRPEIWVTDFPDTADRLQVSSGASDWAFETSAWGWLNEDELWWQTSEGHLAAARILESGLAIEARRYLLGDRVLTENESVLGYSRARDRFLLCREVGARERPELVVVSNWHDALRFNAATP